MAMSAGQHPTAVDRVGHGAAEQRADQRRDELGKTHEADGERRAGEQVRLIEDGDQSELRTHLRHREAQPEPPEGREPPERLKVDDG